MYEVNVLADTLRKGDLTAAKQLIDEGAQLPEDRSGYDRKHIYDDILRKNGFEIIHALVKNKTIETDIYEYDKLDNSIFESLFRNLGTSPEALEFLKDFTAKLDNINDAVQDKTLLGLAFNRCAPIEHIRILVDAGCDINYKNNAEQNYLYEIVREYNIKPEIGTVYLEYLIQEGLDPNAGNIVRETPLHLAINLNKKDYITLLLENGADPNQPGKDGESAFYQALVHQVCDMTGYERIKAYASPDFDAVNNNGETLLCGALRMRRRGSADEVALIKTLVLDGADIYQVSPHYSRGKAPLDWVAEQPADVLAAVLDTGTVELERRDEQGNTLLHKVCAYHVNYDQEAAKQVYRKVKLLIEQGADVNATNDQDQLPMDLAAQDNLKSKTVELLLKHKA